MTRARDVANLIGSGNYSSTTFTATAGQTAFSISHTQGFVQVFMNGLLLDETVDYTSNGSAVTLTSGAAAGDEIEVVAYNTFSVGDALNQAAADTRYVNTSGDTMTGNLLLSSGSIGVGTTSPLRQLSALSTTGNAEVSLVSGTSNQCSILMGDGTTGTDIYKGYLQYDNNTDGMLIATNATSRINIDSAGRVTMPYQPSFAAGVSANNWTTSSAADAPFDTKLYDIGNNFNTSNYTFTAPVTGRYFASVFLNRYSDSRFDIGFMINGSARHVAEIREAGAGQWHVESFQMILSLSANDAVKLRITSVTSTGTAIFDGNGTFYDVFSMHLLG